MKDCVVDNVKVIPMLPLKTSVELMIFATSIASCGSLYIDAAKKLPNINFVCAGQGEYAEQMKDAPNIKDVGFKTGDDLVRLITEAKFSVCPSEWYENCPLSVMESQKYGTPVIGARIGGIPELVIDGKNGLLFESGNAEDLAERIRELWLKEDMLRYFERQCQEIGYDTAEEYVEKVYGIN